MRMGASIADAEARARDQWSAFNVVDGRAQVAVPEFSFDKSNSTVTVAFSGTVGVFLTLLTGAGRFTVGGTSVATYYDFPSRTDGLCPVFVC